MQVFQVESSYTKKQIYEQLQVPPAQQKGSWDTGYREYDGAVYIFANVGIPGRTGHNYSNYWDGDLFNWEAKAGTRTGMPSIKRIFEAAAERNVHIFSRTNDKDPFTYEGQGIVENFEETSPVKIIWKFAGEEIEGGLPVNNGAGNPAAGFREGGLTEVRVNKYERNRAARRECVKHYGAKCQVCEMDFESTYGVLGKGFIHVHHIIGLASIKEDYLVDPVADLIPVCPNCHSMLHKRNPAYTVAELKSLLIPGTLKSF